MISIVPCERLHLESMEGRTIDERPANPQDLNGSVTILRDGAAIGAGGLVCKEGDHYYVWSVLTKECVENHKVTLHKIGRRFIDVVAPNLGIKQITAFIVAGFTTGVEWAEVFGFEYEEYLPAHVLDAPCDYIKMRWLWER